MGVALVTYRSNRDELTEALRALARQRDVQLAVAVHANASDADEIAWIEATMSDSGLNGDVVGGSENVGFATAQNQLIARLFASGCAAVVVHNPDLALAPDAVAGLQAAERAVGGAALFGPVLELAEPVTLLPTGRVDSLGIVWTASGRHLDAQQGEPLPEDHATGPSRVAGISGACLYVPAAAYRIIVDRTGEFFDETFFAYREDAELAWRAGLIGVPSYLVPSARGLHVRHLRGTGREVDPAINRLGVRNRFLIAYKYGAQRPGRLPATLARDAVVIAATLLRERTSRPGLAAAWALRHAMREKRARIRRAIADR